MPIFWCFVDPPKTCILGLIKPCHLLTGLFWEAVDSFAGLFDVVYYILTGESTSNADKFDKFCRRKSEHASYTKEPWDLHQETCITKRVWIGGWTSFPPTVKQKPTLEPFLIIYSTIFKLQYSPALLTANGRPGGREQRHCFSSSEKRHGQSRRVWHTGRSFKHAKGHPQWRCGPNRLWWNESGRCSVATMLTRKLHTPEYADLRAEFLDAEKHVWPLWSWWRRWNRHVWGLQTHGSITFNGAIATQFDCNVCSECCPLVCSPPASINDDRTRMRTLYLTLSPSPHSLSWKMCCDHWEWNQQSTN